MIIRLQQGKELYIDKIEEVREGSVEKEWLHDQFIKLYYKTIEVNNVEAFKITYGRGNGYCIIPSFYVGVIRTDTLTVIIESSIPGLDIGKILYLSTIAETNKHIKVSGDLMEEELENSTSLEMTDYFIISYLDALEEVRGNGLITSYSTLRTVTNSLKGNIDINRQMKKSPSFDKYYTKRNVQSIDNLINQILLKAVKLAIENTKLTWALPMLLDIENSFSGVSDIDIQRGNFQEILEQYTTLTRKDYEKALIIAEHILFGFDPSMGHNYDLFPEYLVDLNEVFEGYTMNSLNKLFIEGFTKKYITSLGIHPEDPPTSQRFLELDGYLEGESRVVLDAKNKYNSIFKAHSNFIPSNPDLFQQYYYAQRLEANYVILIYPSTTKKTKPNVEFNIEHEGCRNVIFLCWQLLVTGTPRENMNALKSLAKFINDLA